MAAQGIIDPATEGKPLAAHIDEFIATLTAAGLLAGPLDFDAPIDDASAAAVHALVGGAGSLLASVQFDDLVGETIATNLPGTDRERANWRRKLRPDIAAAFASPRGRAILAALAKGRM